MEVEVAVEIEVEVEVEPEPEPEALRHCKRRRRSGDLGAPR